MAFRCISKTAILWRSVDGPAFSTYLAVNEEAPSKENEATVVHDMHDWEIYWKIDNNIVTTSPYCRHAYQHYKKKELYEKRERRKEQKTEEWTVLPAKLSKKEFMSAIRDVKAVSTEVDVAAIIREAVAQGREIGAAKLARPVCPKKIARRQRIYLCPDEPVLQC